MSDHADIFKEIKGLTPLSPEQRKVIEEFRREMEEEVIPEIVNAVERRQELAAESRTWQLKH